MSRREPLHTFQYGMCIERYETPDELPLPCTEQFHDETKAEMLEYKRVKDRIEYLGTDSVLFFFQWEKEPKNAFDTEGRELWAYDISIYIVFFNKEAAISTNT